MASLIRIPFRVLGTSKPLLVKPELKFVRTIMSKQQREILGVPPKPKPWPYKEKKFTFFHQYIDRTSARMDENSKIIVVEGPIASGKSEFAKKLAEDLDMLYLPEANQDMIYYNEYGFDYRSLDSQLPESCRSFDINNFLVNPKHSRTALFQLIQYEVKFSQYIDALAHLFSTGQGVVLDRCCYSDFVFLEAMYSQGYISKNVRRVYYDRRKIAHYELLRPHLVIYLDVPVRQVQANIKKRNLTYEVNSPALTDKYLTVMERTYKQEYLKDISKHAELLVYDWSEGGDAEVVVEDIERITFENYDSQETKMKDWEDFFNEEDWAVARRKFCNQKDQLLNLLEIPYDMDCPELYVDAEDGKEMFDIYDNAPGNKYEYGFNKDMGDKNLLLKWWGPYRETLPLRERRKF